MRLADPSRQPARRVNRDPATAVRKTKIMTALSITLSAAAASLLRTESHRVALSRLQGAYSTDFDGACNRAVQKECLLHLRRRANQRAAGKAAEVARSGQMATAAYWSPRKDRGLTGHQAAYLDSLARRLTRRKEAAKAAAKAAKIKMLRGGRIGRASLTALIPDLTGQVTTDADAAMRAVCRLVGRIGEQVEADLLGMRTSEDFDGRKSRNHKLERTTLHRVEHRADWSAALITLEDFRSFGSRGAGGYSSRGGSSYRCFLAVRDTTTGECHLLRVPPKFGNGGTKFFKSFDEPAAPLRLARRLAAAEKTAKKRLAEWHARRTSADAVELYELRNVAYGVAYDVAAAVLAWQRSEAQLSRIRAAIAWTFGLAGDQYDPQVEA